MPRFLRCLAFGAVVSCLEPVLAADALEEALEKGDYATAEVELEKLADEWQQAWKSSGTEEDGRQYGLTLQALGAIERQAGKATEALPHLEAALPLLSSSDATTRADALETLALSHQDLGHQDEAERGLREVVKLRENGPRDLWLQSRDHLGISLLTGGHYAEAKNLLEENLDQTPAKETSGKARRLGYVARCLHTLGSHAKAATMLRDAIDLAAGNEELQLSLRGQLALADLRLGKTEEARRGLDQAATDAARIYRQRQFLAAPHFINLGAFDLSTGNAESAREAFSGALRLIESSLPADHPSLIAPLNNLGCAEQAIGDLENAAIHLKRAAALQAQHYPRLHLRTAETARNLARNALLTKSPDAPAEIASATNLGIELMGELIQVGTEKERLNFLQRLDLVSLPCATGDAGEIADTLIATKARLLDALLAGNSHPPLKLPVWQEIQKTLPAGSAFVDACRYVPEGDDATARFGAVVLLPDGPPKWISLGSEEDLQRWLEVFRKRLAWRAATLSGEDSPAPPLKLRGILRSLHREFWEPIAKKLPAETLHIAFSPDGALHFLPLAALLDADMQPISRHYRQLTTFASARDLMNPPAEKALSRGPWELLGVSEFPKSKSAPDGNPLLELLAGLGDMPGTAKEIDLLASLAPSGSHILRDSQATESSLATLASPPVVLHLGSHAFFLPADLTPGIALDFDDRADLLRAGGLLLHGAALRGPNSPMFAPDDDLLFPAEVAKLPLQGTRLVTLSSCESGAGTAVSGEGVLGLRRGFALAGAREVVVALWPVSDRSTPEFMERFYRLALASDRPAQALWQCQGEFLARATSEDEFETAVLRYAPFVIGQNTPLSTGEEIRLPESPAGFPWRRAWIVLPLLAFLAARLLRKKAA